MSARPPCASARRQPEELITVRFRRDGHAAVPLPPCRHDASWRSSWTAQDGELTLANNRVALQAEGVRENLRVLLVSGEPHAGERTWRNLLRSDAVGRSRAFHHPAPAGEAGRHADQPALADRLPDPRAVLREAVAVRPDHLRPLSAARRAAAHLSRQCRALCRRGRRGAGRGRRRFRFAGQPVPHAAGRRAAGRSPRAGSSSGRSSRWSPRLGEKHPVTAGLPGSNAKRRRAAELGPLVPPGRDRRRSTAAC